eukprot:COSAG02_NODE_6429_length_3565_cov_23.710132_2_plen_44_part_00
MVLEYIQVMYIMHLLGTVLALLILMSCAPMLLGSARVKALCGS